MPTINRGDLLRHLECVQPGLTSHDAIQQSSCFAFSGGHIYTYNDEITCHCPSPLGKSVEGAVQASSLLSLLQKMTEIDIAVETGDGELLIRGKNKRAGVRMESKIELPIKTIERPKVWHRLPDDFCEAVQIVHQCAAQAETPFVATCVHIHPDWIEACDDRQLCRWNTKMGIKTAMLVRRASIKYIPALGMTEFGETEKWLHFKNDNDLVLSCRRMVQEFPNLSKVLSENKGSPTQLPKGLEEAADKANVFSSENDMNLVQVDLQPGKIRIRGKGASGWFTESKKVQYKGNSFSFLIPPALLSDLARKHSECMLSQDRLKIDTGKYRYVSCLSKPKQKEKEKGEE